MWVPGLLIISMYYGYVFIVSLEVWRYRDLKFNVLQVSNIAKKQSRVVILNGSYNEACLGGWGPN